VIDPTGRFMYVTDNGANTLDHFVLNQTDGTLGSMTQTTGLNGPQFVVVDRLGKFLYVVSDDGNIYAFNINQTDGTLTPSSTPTYSLGASSGPLGATIDPSNKYLYTANDGDNTVSAFTIDANGILTANGTLNVGGAAPPLTLFVDKVVVDPSSKYLYVLDSGDTQATIPNLGGVYAYALGANGALTSNMTPIAGSPFGLAGNPVGSIVIDPTGKLLAAENNTSPTGSISLFTVNSDGSLTAITPAVATGDTPWYVTFYNAP
jgi:6-phosphogluconolactonase (cycloisomerase 2 family)